ncbi:ventrally expressed dharma/bozozok antagonist [Anoplopoma fimbria]|uniref:ventrally expressed dharma/bozozok antagonist n=1 Tax=Anoplopoma fimbria TaxID=229290 RepID=UPI0023EDFC8E|nr:ventrally expressed dharma/bozozok antagonist [Anoplopoma fimbria]
MRGHFSIEWMAQSSQPAGTETGSSSRPGPGPGPVACGTHSESLPGFYCRQKLENSPKQQESRNQSLDAFSLKLQNSNNQVSEAGFSSGTEEEETSGYESEGGHSLSISTSTSPPASPPLGRRPRTAFTAEQISSLERSFKRNAYLGTQDKAELCKKLSLSDKQIRNWFQNRRMKLKRTVQDALAHACHANVSSQFMHYPELQAFRPGPYSRYHSAAAPDLHPPHGLQYGSSLPSVASLPLDSFYQYSSLPGVMLPPSSSPLMASYSTHPQYY